MGDPILGELDKGFQTSEAHGIEQPGVKQPAHLDFNPSSAGALLDDMGQVA